MLGLKRHGFIINLKKSHLCPFQELVFLGTNIRNLDRSLPLSTKPHTHVITTDASGSGWGGVLDDTLMVQGLWDHHQLSWHLNRLEMQAVILTLAHFVKELSGTVILVRSDNTTVCSYLNKVGGMQSDALCKQTLDLCRWTLRHNMELRAIYLPGQTNCQAGALSRQRQKDLSPFQDLDNREWTLNASVLEAVFLQFGHPQVDLFANMDNKRLPVFVSLQRGQGELAVDTLSLSWTHQ